MVTSRTFFEIIFIGMFIIVLIAPLSPLSLLREHIVGVPEVAFPASQQKVSSQPEQAANELNEFPTAPDIPPPKPKRKPAPVTAIRPESPAQNISLQSMDAFIIEIPVSRYEHDPISLEIINTRARAALVNIFCTTSGGSLNPISASGVMISDGGVILTNAHVGQYFLLEKDMRVDLSCVIRNGSPAKNQWEAELAYLPPAWIEANAHKIREKTPMGTGEHDWALLRITEAIDGSSVQSRLPFVTPEFREEAIITGDTILAAAYPAGFVGGAIAQKELSPASTVTTIQKLLTFGGGNVDAFSIGGVIIAQGGSSGGAVVNAWNRLTGIIVTSSKGETTSERDLRALTLAHINESAKANAGADIAQMITNIGSISAEFQQNVAPSLAEQLISELK